MALHLTLTLKENYKTWKIDNYIEEISPFIESAIPKLTEMAL
jgi:hypothetical protein